MTGRTHDLAAISALGVVVLLYPPENVTLATAIVAVFANLIGGIAPDIDQPTAPFWRNLPIGGMFGRFFDRLLGGHRFLTHSILGLVLFSFGIQLLLAFFQPVMHGVDTHLVWLAFMIGMVSHLAMDLLTKEGVPLLLPIPIKFGIPPLKRMRITTGKAAEILLVFPGLVAFDAYFYYVHYQEIIDILHHHLG